ncbi:MAG: GDSL-type esterase/lipase family protein, partial [Methanobacteriota archaeon]
IVCLGDSYTEGWGAEPYESFPAILEEMLAVPVLNEGWRGETADVGYARLDSTVLVHEPRLVLVEYGGNEAMYGLPVERALSGIERILVRLSAARIPVLLLGVRIPTYGPAWPEGLTTLARRFDAELLFGFLDGILEDPQLVSDPEHPNAAGYRLVAERLAPVVARLLQ